MNTNNGVKRKNRDFKYEFLKQFKDKSLSGMLTVLIDNFSPRLATGTTQKLFFLHPEFAENIPWPFN